MTISYKMHKRRYNLIFKQKLKNFPPHFWRKKHYSATTTESCENETARGRDQVYKLTVSC
eukprot:m.101804 g.101804  ORF g.101804 m.101804 type:complete len:60 (-) comp22308_c0_seq2:316-495(-)